MRTKTELRTRLFPQPKKPSQMFHLTYFTNPLVMLKNMPKTVEY
jgi:hypothetical protein